MARIARVVLPGTPHHVTQRGNRRQQVFFCDADYRDYLNYLAVGCRAARTACWAYCLMPNHVHLVLVPEMESGLCEALAEVHRHYSRMINSRYGWRGHLWQERFHSFPMDEKYLLATVRYVELNPVRAGMVNSADEWLWSSACAHLYQRQDVLLNSSPVLDSITDWHAYLQNGSSDAGLERLRRHTRTGRPLGSDDFLDLAERATGRELRPGRPGRKPGLRREVPLERK